MLIPTEADLCLCIGAGEAVPVWRATHHGPADEVALEVEREQRFSRVFLSQDSILATAWQHYAIFQWCEIGICVHGTISTTKRSWIWSKTGKVQPGCACCRFPRRFHQKQGESNVAWIKKVLVMLTLTSDGKCARLLGWLGAMHSQWWHWSCRILSRWTKTGAMEQALARPPHLSSRSQGLSPPSLDLSHEVWEGKLRQETAPAVLGHRLIFSLCIKKLAFFRSSMNL